MSSTGAPAHLQQLRRQLLLRGCAAEAQRAQLALHGSHVFSHVSRQNLLQGLQAGQGQAQVPCSCSKAVPHLFRFHDSLHKPGKGEGEALRSPTIILDMRAHRGAACCSACLTLHQMAQRWAVAPRARAVYTSTVSRQSRGAVALVTRMPEPSQAATAEPAVKQQIAPPAGPSPPRPPHTPPLTRTTTHLPHPPATCPWSCTLLPALQRLPMPPARPLPPLPTRRPAPLAIDAAHLVRVAHRQGCRASAAAAAVSAAVTGSGSPAWRRTTRLLALHSVQTPAQRHSHRRREWPHAPPSTTAELPE